MHVGFIMQLRRLRVNAQMQHTYFVEQILRLYENENAQVPATANKVHIIAMAHINDRPNLVELTKKLEDILVAEGPYTICFELPKSAHWQKAIRKTIEKAERNGPPEEGNFFTTMFWEFAKLKKDGVDVQPIDKRIMLQPLMYLQFYLGTSSHVLNMQKKKYSKMAYEDAEKLTIAIATSRRGEKFEEKVLDKRNEVMLKNIGKILRRDGQRPLVIMVGSLHAEYIGKRLEEQNMAVEISMTPRTRMLTRIDKEGKEACQKGPVTEEDRLAVAKLTVMELAVLVYGGDEILNHVPLINSLKSKEEAEKLFALMQISLRS